MLYREIMAICSEIHTKHINILCGQNVELLNVKLVVYIVTTGLSRVKAGHNHYLPCTAFLFASCLGEEPKQTECSGHGSFPTFMRQSGIYF
jgi:hypothetical protein